MKWNSRLWFTFVCIMMLFVSTVSPSLVLAVDRDFNLPDDLENEIENNIGNEEVELPITETEITSEIITEDNQPGFDVNYENGHTIQIHAGEGRTDIFGEGRIKGDSKPIFYSRNTGNVVELVSTKSNWNPDETYQILISLFYLENGIQNQYIDLWSLTGKELEETTEFVIPDTNKLEVTHFQDGYLNFIESPYINFYFNDFEIGIFGKIVTSKEKLIGKMYLKGETIDRWYLLNMPFTMGTEIDFQYLSENTSEITVNKLAKSIDIYKEDEHSGFYLSDVENKSLIVSNGKYQIYFTNNYDWQGELDLSSSQTVVLPDEPTDFKIVRFEQYIDPSTSEITLHYSLTLSSDTFGVRSFDSATVNFDIDGDLLLKWSSPEIYGQRTFQSTDIKKGKHILNATLNFNGKEWSTNREIDIDSPFQSLKGTVITAENKTGDELKSGIVSIYKIDSSSGSLIVRVPIKQEDEKFEAFIPDTYLLSGNEYLVVVKSEEEKVVYAKKIVGQEEKYITFTSDTLKEIEFGSGNIQTIKTHFYFMDSNGDSFIPQEINGAGWSISGEYDLQATWLGQLGETGYEWSGKIGRKEKTVDLTKIDWQTIKPSPHYVSAKVKSSYFEESFKELKVNDLGYGWKYAELIVNDNDLVYFGGLRVPLHLGVGILTFGHFTGGVYQNTERNEVYTYFSNYFGNLQDVLAEVGGDLSLEYEIYDEENRLIGNRIKTDNINSFKLPNPLPVGMYKIKLVDSNLNPGIITLSLDSTLVVEDNPGMREWVTLSIPIETDTIYGEVYSNRSMRIDMKHSDDNYYPFAWLDWDEKTKTFNTREPIGINANNNYILTAQYEVERSGSKLIDEQKLSGSELINFSNESPLKISTDLKLLTVETHLEGNVVEFILQNPVSNRYYEVHQYPNYNIYIPSGIYSLTIGRGNGWPAKNIVSLPELNITQDKKLTLTEEGLSEVSFYNNREQLDIIRYLPQRYYYNPNENITSFLYEKGKYENLQFFVATEDDLQTPWAYHLVVPTIDLTKDQRLHLSNDINGKINRAHLQSDEYGELWLSVDYTLLSEDLIVESIYHTMEQNRHDVRPFTMMSEDPIRDYNGQFNEWRKVEPTYSLMDQSGKLIWKMSREYWDDVEKGIPLRQNLPSGEYTLELLIPTGPQKSITLTDKIIIGESENASVEISSPVEGQVLNQKSVTVKGKTKTATTVTIELIQGEDVIDFASVSTEANGGFSYTFKSLADGSYFIRALTNRASHGVPFTIDTSTPGKVTGIQYSNEAEGLRVSWNAASNATSYTVEVAEGDRPFEMLSSTGRTAFIPNRKASITYHVRITAHSGTGKVNVSEIVSYKVPSEGNTGGTGGTDNNGGEGSIPVNPKPVESIETNPDSEKDSVEKSVLNQIMDSSKNEISIEFSTDENNTDKLTATFDSTIWKQVLESKKPLIIKANGVSMRIPTETIKGIATRDGGQVIVKIVHMEETNLPKISGNQQLLSPLYDFSIVVKKGDQEREITSFTTPISITVEIGSVKNAKKVAAYYLNEKEMVWEYVGGALLNDSFTFDSLHFSKYAVIENDKTFVDIHEVGWAAEYIEVLASKNIIQGKTEDLFAPSEEITRAQFAALLSRAMNLPKETYVGIFHDVSELNWAAQDIEAANRAGIVGGENGLFKPGEKITRQQMAAMIIRAVEYKNPKLLDGVEHTLPFIDAPSISDYAKKYVGLSVSLGIISGREEKGVLYFAPKENATRAHAAKMLYQFMELN